MKIIAPGKLKLKDHQTDYTAQYKKDDVPPILEKLKSEMHDLQERLYATGQYSVLILLQGMDASGKDSIIEHVMSGLNPQGCQVYSFKQPSAEENKHDFLWRHSKALPELGRIGIHNRSHYENVLICKVHPEIIPLIGNIKPDKKFWDERYESIRDFEKHLARNRIIILKFFLHLSKEEQKNRFLERIDIPLKNWKFSSLDVKERQFWDQYMEVYEQAINQTATEDSPWYVIPADKKWYARLAILEIMVEKLRSLDLGLPKLDKKEQENLAACKKMLEAEK